jgi:pimeloyl-ACP methyl ester carboxylesterase
MYHRTCVDAGPTAHAIIHVHGFGISGTYLEPTAALLAPRYRTFIPDLPGMGRSICPERPLDLAGLTRALMSYCDTVGVERATFVGNSLGCPLIVEVATTFPDRIDRAVFVSPAGGPSNQPLGRAIGQMARDGFREPWAMLPIAVRDYLTFGVLRSLSLFAAMTAYPTLERLPNLVVPTLVIVGARDPLVRMDRMRRLSVLPCVEAVQVPGAHALNFSTPEVVATLIESHMNGEPAAADDARGVVLLEIPGRVGVNGLEPPASTV